MEINEINNLKEIRNQRKKIVFLGILNDLIAIILAVVFMITGNFDYMMFSILFLFLSLSGNINLRYWDTKYNMIKLLKGGQGSK